MTSTKPTQINQLGVILDMDGTLMKGNQPLPGLRELFISLKNINKPYRIVTNNATHSPLDYQQKLAQCGVKVPTHTILTSAIATATTLQNQLQKGSAIYVIGQPALVSALTEVGFTILKGVNRGASAVVVGGDPSLTYDKLKFATLHIQRGSHFFGTNPDLVYPTEEGLVPECGTTLAALEAATGVSPIIIGKPSPILFELAMADLGTIAKNTVVVGDRLETDILGGLRAGCKTILITTGVDRASSIQHKSIQPDHIVQDLTELTNLLHNGL